MITQYTTNISNEIYFLNDGNIAHELSSEISLNPIPSLSLLNRVNDDLTSKIESDISNLNSTVGVENAFVLSVI